jgi:hypothetical protein
MSRFSGSFTILVHEVEGFGAANSHRDVLLVSLLCKHFNLVAGVETSKRGLLALVSFSTIFCKSSSPELLI